MSIEISNNYGGYKTEYEEQLRNSREQTAEKASKGFTPKDEYISSEKSNVKPSGLYRLGKDENGNPKILFDDPKKKPKVKSDSPKNSEECTGNTDKVDREIKKLKEEKKKLEQQIKTASQDENKIRHLKQKLAQIEGELNQKDTDAYRRQNSSFT